MAQIMKVQIRVILPHGIILLIPVYDDETFKEFQERVDDEYDLFLEKAYFKFENHEIQDKDILSKFINSYNSASTDEHTDTILYEISLENSDENAIFDIKNEGDTSSENIEQEENYMSLKEVENLPPLINLTETVTENNSVINVLNEPIFDNITYEIVDTDNEINVKDLQSNNTEINEIELTENNAKESTESLISSDLMIIDNENEKSTENENIYRYIDIESKLREIHDTVEESVTDFCRLCAKTINVEDKNLIYGEDDRFDEKINNCLPIKVDVKDGLPQQLCGHCLEQLKNISEFVQTVLESDKVLRLKFISTGSEVNNKSNKLSENVKFESEMTDLEYLDISNEENVAENYPELKCRFCDILLNDTNMCVDHSIKVHTSKSGLCVCVLCDLGYTTPEILKEHIIIKHQKQFENRSRNFQCKVCLRRYTTEILLQKHTCTKGIAGKVSLHCEVCNETFSSKIRLNFHRQFHLKNARPLYCFQCRINFNDENQYFDHVNFLHESKQIFVCNICDKTFNLRSSFNNHKKKHLSDRRYKCETCNKLFLNKQTLQEHEVIHMSTKPHQCHLCGEKYNRMSRLRKHLLTHDSDPVLNDVFICTICQECFANEENGKEHCGNDHCNDMNCIEVVSMDRVFRCEFCEKCFSTPDSLNIHRVEHNGNLPYTCHICKAQFASFARCTSHKTTHGIFKDDGEKDNFPVVKHFLCDKCGKSYVHWSYLSLHRKLKHAENMKTYKCPHCYKEFLNVAGLNYHIKSAHAGASCKCDHCGKLFANPKTLLLHSAAAHSDKMEKNFKCEKCDKVFSYQVGLDAHMKTHSNTKEHKCPKCSKSFSYATSLTNHMKQCHEDHSPNQLRNTCMFCGKKFNTKSEYEAHQLLHKKGKFNCDICDKNFESKNLLLTHNRIHMHRPFVCDICGLGFRKPYSLKTHINRHVKSKNSGSFVLMVDMKEDQIETQEKSQETINAEQSILENQFTDSSVQLNLNSLSENYIDMGNGNYLQIQGNTVNIDGTDYILLPGDGKSADSNEVQMVVDDNYTENQLPVVTNLDNSVVLVDSDNQIILNENQGDMEYVLATNNSVKQNATYFINNQFV